MRFISSISSTREKFSPKKVGGLERREPLAETELSIRLPAIVATLDPNFAFDKLFQQVEIQTTLLTILAGVIGYFINGWLTKTRPFVSVIQTSGASLRVGSKVQVPDRAVKSSEQSNLCNGLSNSSRLKDAMDALATTKKLKIGRKK